MRVLSTIVLGLCIGCSPGGSTSSQVPPAGPRLVVDPALAQEGITVTEKAREKSKLILTFGSTEKDHESSNYSYTLYDQGGGRMQSNAVSIPAFKKGSTFELELDNDDFAKSSKVVIGFFGK